METPNTLYHGDNLDVLREQVASESIDLIYLDPPFNSQATYNILFRSSAGTGSRQRSKLSPIRGAGARKAITAIAVRTHAR